FMTASLVISYLTSLFLLSCFFFFSSRRRHTRFDCDWSSDVCSSDLVELNGQRVNREIGLPTPYAWSFSSTDGVGVLGICSEPIRSEERRVGKECRSWWSAYP